MKVKIERNRVQTIALTPQILLDLKKGCNTIANMENFHRYLDFKKIQFLLSPSGMRQARS